MLYTKRAGDISWQNVETFCQQQIAEGAYLDYKQDFPAHLERTIAAMANTLGGIILIGVQANAQNKPQLPITGIPLVPELSERVTQVVLTNLTPPVFPEIAVCENATKNHAVIVIRVAQSHQAPHAIAHNTDVYLRTGDRNQPEARADLDKIEWLKDHRTKSEELRAVLHRRAIARVASFHEWHSAERKPEESRLAKIDVGWLEISLVPLYPRERFRTPPELSQLREQVNIEDRYSGPGKFPMPWRARSQIVQDGVVFSEAYEELTFHTELNGFGLLFYSQSLLRAMTSCHPRRLHTDPLSLSITS